MLSGEMRVLGFLRDSFLVCLYHTPLPIVERFFEGHRPHGPLWRMIGELCVILLLDFKALVEQGVGTALT